MKLSFGALLQRYGLYLLLLLYLPFKSYAEDPAILKADSLYRKADYRHAITVLEARLSLAQKNNETIIKIVLYNSLGKAYSQIGESIEALKNYQLAIKMTELTGDKQRTGKILKNIGALYEEQKNFTQALSYYDKAQDIAIALKDQSLLADCYNNRGVIYEQQLKYGDALQVYKNALTIYQKLNIPDRIALTFNNIGIVYKFQKEFAQSLDYYSRSLILSEKLGDRYFVAANLNNIGNVYALMKNYPKAIEFNTRALKIAEEIKATNIVVEASGSLADDYAGIGDLKKALEFKDKFIAVKENYINLERSGQMAEMQTRYETEKKENQIVTLKQQQQISSLNIAKQQLLLQKRNYQIFTVTGIAVCLVIFGYLYNHRQRVKQQLEKLKTISDTEKQERTRIAKDIHDDMGAGLSKIILMSGMVEDKIKTSDYGTKEIANIKQISQELVDNMRDLIWVLNPENATLDNLVARIREYCSDYLEGLSVITDLNIQHDVPYVRISQQMQRNIFLTIKEALHNCVKHANCDKIAIALTFNNGILTVSVTDSGKGFEADELKRKGNGLRNMQQRIQSIGGKFTINSVLGGGTTVQTSIQLS